MRILISILFISLCLPQDCEDCVNVWFDSYWGDQCCDVAWNQWGFDCDYMENEYGWDCTGCNCPHDENPTCGDEYCNGDENIENCSSDCTINGCNIYNQVDDCADGDCCPTTWIGDGYEDCEDPNNFGCDLSCYNNDGGDCSDCNIESGDINADCQINILDLVQIVNYILDDSYDEIGDINEDGELNILDLVQIVNYILEI
ncbi:uncharacterized protein METZ01_LOCUS225286 [marine metagenome]|uniref:Dockerin domain-containing protein n=1 Tax=marine metagenome TaxID=408172 RepID=A0A382GC52_9ZZZZ